MTTTSRVLHRAHCAPDPSASSHPTMPIPASRSKDPRLGGRRGVPFRADFKAG
jgi:hypothetical protein